jgi:dihydroflavonol-4-reductase
VRAFVTGGTGFIGQRLVQQLIARGDQVSALARSDSSAAHLKALGAHVVRGDILDVESLRSGMLGADVVFHLAALYELGVQDPAKMEAINVDGTRNVLGVGHELGIPKLVYTSTVAVFGDTQGRLVAESYRYDGPFLSDYDRTKWLAQYQVAEPLMERGAPVVIVMPGVVYGPGDTTVTGELLRMFWHGLLPVVPGPEQAVTYAHVDDVVAGHILAAERGEPGESYVLAGPPFTFGDLFDLWADVSGRPRPLFGIPARFMRPLAPVMGIVGRFVALPQSLREESIRVLGATYLARANKAKAELGWEPRPVRQGLTETFDWLAEAEPPLLPGLTREAAVVGLVVAVVAAKWLSRR